MRFTRTVGIFAVATLVVGFGATSAQSSPENSDGSRGPKPSVTVVDSPSRATVKQNERDASQTLRKNSAEHEDADVVAYLLFAKGPLAEQAKKATVSPAVNAVTEAARLPTVSATTTMNT